MKLCPHDMILHNIIMVAIILILVGVVGEYRYGKRPHDNDDILSIHSSTINFLIFAIKS